MEFKSSWPFLQHPASESYFEPDEFNPQLNPYFLKIYFSIIIPSTLKSPKWYARYKNSDQNFVFISYLPHFPHISFSLISTPCRPLYRNKLFIHWA